MAETAPSREFTTTVADWKRSTDAELIFLASAVDADIPRGVSGPCYSDGELLYEPETTRHLAVFCVDACTEYVVITDDGTGEPLRSWTVDATLVLDYPDRQYYVIPGFEARDRVIIPHLGTAVVGGMGNTTMEQSDESRIFDA